MGGKESLQMSNNWCKMKFNTILRVKQDGTAGAPASLLQVVLNWQGLYLSLIQFLVWPPQLEQSI